NRKSRSGSDRAAIPSTRIRRRHKIALDLSVSHNLPLVMAYANALTVLADPTRRKVFERLRVGPRPVKALAAGLPVSRPAVSQHLKALKDAGLVKNAAKACAGFIHCAARG